MPQITVGNAFFTKELHSAYSRWAEAFHRENFQNSGDAGASHIRVSLTPRPDLGEHIVRVVHEDNGCGMTRDILDNVFFRLGESTKDGNGTQTGGFGRARILTHFAQHAYLIETGDLRVSGKGAEYHYETATEHVPGCRMTLDVIALDRYGYPVDLEAALLHYLRRCQPSYTVTVNGVRFTDWTYRRQAVRTLPFGTVHVNKSAMDKDALYGEALVRVNGTLMFTTEIEPKVRVIIEVDPAKSRHVLTSNRDGFTYEANREFVRFIAELNTEVSSALKPKNLHNRTIVHGTGSFSSRPRDRAIICSSRTTMTSPRCLSALRPITPVKPVHVIIDSPVPVGSPTAAAPGNYHYTYAEGAASLLPETPRSSTEPDRVTDGQPVNNNPHGIPLSPGDIPVSEPLRRELFDIVLLSDLETYDEAHRSALRSAVRRHHPDH